MKDSPMTIARALACEGSPMSPETLYRAIYAHGHRGLAGGLHVHLHRRRRCRKRRLAKDEQAKKTNPLGNFSHVKDRPAIAGQRSEVGHFEGDLIIGERGRSAVVSLVLLGQSFGERALARPCRQQPGPPANHPSTAGPICRQHRERRQRPRGCSSCAAPNIRGPDVLVSM